MDDSAVRDLYRALLDAWNARDATAYAGLLSDDALVIGFDGSQMVGPADVRATLERIFADHPTAAYVAQVQAVRPVGADGAVLHALAGMVPPGAEEVKPELNAVQTLVATRQGAGWEVVLFQNTAAHYHGRPDLAERHTQALQS